MADPSPSHRTIDPFSREVLEFPAVLELLHRYLSGPISEPLLDTGRAAHRCGEDSARFGVGARGA